ncbi:MAG: TPM domain-containing protein [Candidatus Fimisoma sp.]
MKKILKIWALLVMIIFMAAPTAFAGIPEKSQSFYVADYANVISQETENYIVEKNGQLENLCGGQIVVVAVDFLDGMDIEDYAYKVFKEWQIGSAEKNNGVLLLLAIGEDNYWCMQGKGLESEISSGEIDDMLWEYLEEDFASADYDAGVRKFFDKMFAAVSEVYSEGDVTETKSADTGSVLRIISLLIKILVVVIIIVVIIKGTRKNRYDTGRAAERRTDAGRTNRPSARPVILPRPSRTRSRGTYRTTRPTSGSSSGRTSVSRPSGRGGGGISRGGGAGRRGR